MELRRISISICLLLAGMGCAGTPATLLSTQGQSNSNKIIIAAWNDFHGAFSPIESGEPGVSAGGAAIFASYIKILKNEFPSNLLLLDAGDQWQGTIDSNRSMGESMVAFYNRLGVTASAIGNHEFDFEPDAASDPLSNVKQRFKEAEYPYLASNIYDKTTGKPLNIPNMKPWHMVEMNGTKVALIGLSALDTLHTTSAKNIQFLEFRPLLQITHEKILEAKQQGAHVIILIAHEGTRCDDIRMGSISSIRKWNPKAKQGSCDPGSEIVKLIRTLPKRSIDLVVAGHTHQIVHHWIDGTPIIEAGASGLYLNIVTLTIDPISRRVISDQTQINGPIPVCHKVFSNQQDCDGKKTPPPKGRGKLVENYFRNQLIEPDPSIERFLKPIFKETQSIKGEILASTREPVTMSRLKESDLGNLIADAIRNAAQTDFAFVNPGGIRAEWNQGLVTYGDVYKTLPFDNTITLLRVTGKELKTILSTANNGSRGFYSISGLQMTLIDLPYKAPVSDLNHSGSIEPFEVSRLKDLRNYQGEAILDSKFYTVATIDFLARGGDDLAFAMSQIPKDRIQFDIGLGYVRDVVAKYIKEHSPLEKLTQNSRNQPRLFLARSKTPNRSQKRWR